MKNLFKLKKLAFSSGALALSACLLSMPAAANTITGVMYAPLRSLDPIITTAYTVRNFGYMVYDTLLAVDADGNIQPQMLEKWTVSDDGKTYTFELRDGLKWHDGNDVTTEDIVASIERWSALDKAGQIMNSLLEETEIIDDKTFSMKFKESTDIALRAMAKPSSVPALMMPKRLAETPTSEQIKEVVGSGPFKFSDEEYRPGVQAVFEKNTDYVPRDEPASGLAGGKVVNVDKVKWVSMPDSMTAISALTNGEIDYIEQTAHDMLPLLEGKDGVKIKVQPLQGAQTEMRFNFIHPPFDNKLVRQAALMAIDQASVLQSQIGDPEYYQTCAAVFGCSSPYASDKDNEDVIKAQTEKAKALLKEANYDGTPIVILHPTDMPTIASVVPVFAQALKNVGFNVDMQSMDWQTVVNRRASQDLPKDGGWNIFSTFTVMADIQDPISFMGVAANGDDAWFGWPDIPEIEDLRAQFARSDDPDELKEIASKINDLVIDEGVIVPLGEFSVIASMSDKLNGLIEAPVPVFWNVTKDD